MTRRLIQLPHRHALLRGIVAAALLFTLAAPFGTRQLAAQSDQGPGLEIAARSDRSDRGFGDSEVKMTMVSRDQAGQETRRTMQLQVLENEDEDFGDKTLVVFETPEDVAGTTLLSHANILTADDQWLFLPALGSVRQITSANKTGPFAGSEFSFEDFTSQELNKFSYTLIGEEACGEFMCDVVERIPLYEDSGYSRQVGLYDQEVFQLRKVEYFDRRGDLLKTLIMDDYREYGDGIWRAHRLAMESNQSGKSTELLFDDFVFGAGLDPAAFESGSLSAN